jgi:cardiolipin synthase
LTILVRAALRSGLASLLALAPACVSAEKHLTELPDHLYGTHDDQFLRTMDVLGGPPLVRGNRIGALQNGDEIFPAMLEAIRGAQRSVNFVTYIYWSGEIGHQFAAAFAERARAGVKVNVLVDWLGSGRIDADDVELMKEAGVHYARFHPLHWYSVHRLNNRLHRKILVVDGRIGFTGGVGIAEQWTGDAQDRDHWRDSHFRFEGPVVAQMQSVFVDNWVETTGRLLDGPDYFPELTPAGSQTAQVFSSSPTKGSDAMEIMYVLAITAAEKSICLSSAYFIPGELERAALLAALHRGVTVEIITPGEYMDVETVRHASRALWGDLLEAGARIYEYEPTMYHCKVLIVDDCFVSVGSTNFDPRSFRTNDEVNLNIYDEEFGRAAHAVFREDLEHAQEIDLQRWQSRPWTEKFVEHTAALLEDFL